MSHKLNLKIYFGDDLHDYPECPEDLKSFVENEFQEINKLSGDEKFKGLSRLGTQFRQMGNYGKAHELFEQASNYFEKINLKMTMVNYLRWADVFRFEKRFDEASEILKKAKEILFSQSFLDYQDFYFQHLGKLYFDKGEYKEALDLFEKALEIRNQKKNIELISSTEFALKITRQKLG